MLITPKYSGSIEGRLNQKRRHCMVDTKMIDEADRKYIARLRVRTSESLELFSSSNEKKAEREKMVCAAFLRCLGIEFLSSEIKSLQQNDHRDVIFREAAFQVRESLDHGRKRGDEYKVRYETLLSANKIEDTLVLIESPTKMSYKELYEITADGLSEKFQIYGLKGCESLDALVYINQKRFLDTSSDVSAFDKLMSQGWRSVSLLFLPYSHVIYAKKDAPEFLKINAGQTKKECDNSDIWFKLD
jgi:hypothetical protein